MNGVLTTLFARAQRLSCLSLAEIGDAGRETVGLRGGYTAGEMLKMHGTVSPGLYDIAPRLRMYDPLAHFLGAADGGVIVYSYLDVVKLAGHSCPTVVSAYLMTLRGLQRLYGETLPVRGDIEVYFRDPEASGVIGVMASVVSFLTGAAREGGFKGLNGRFDRRNLLGFEAPIDGQIGFRRRDTGAAVQVRFDGRIVPAPVRTENLLERALAADFDSPEGRQFRAFWQDRLHALLASHAEDPRLVVVSDWDWGASDRLPSAASC